MGFIRKTYTDQFKAEAVKVAEDIGIGRAAKDLGVNPGNIHRWKTGAKGGAAGSPVSEKSMRSRELEKENRKNL